MLYSYVNVYMFLYLFYMRKENTLGSKDSLQSNGAPSQFSQFQV